MTKDALETRLAQAQQAKAEQIQRHAQLQAAMQETVAQINALIGREQELTELLALIDAPTQEGA